MNENKCDDCPKFKTLVSGWKCCMSNSCEMDVRADERRKFAGWCKKNNVQCRKKLDGEWIQFSVSDIVADYEKEQKNAK